MIGKCTICGRNAEYFTDAYDPENNEKHVFPLCKRHQTIVFMQIRSVCYRLAYSNDEEDAA